MIIRPAQPSDTASIQELNNQVFEHDAAHDENLKLNWPYTKEGEKYYASLANGTYGACFIIEDNGTAVGYVALHEKEFGYRHGKVLEIENIGVRPEYRGKGVGKQLMEHVRVYAKEHGYNRLYVAAYWKNQLARGFYESCGFEPVGVEYEMGV